MTPNGAAKIKAFPPPSHLSVKERRVWCALVVQCPLSTFTAAEHTLMITYCKTDSIIDDFIARMPRLLRSELAKLAKLVLMQRQIALRLNIRALAAKEARSVNMTLEHAAAQVLKDAQDPGHRRHSLYGPRIR